MVIATSPACKNGVRLFWQSPPISDHDPAWLITWPLGRFWCGRLLPATQTLPALPYHKYMTRCSAARL